MERNLNGVRWCLNAILIACLSAFPSSPAPAARQPASASAQQPSKADVVARLRAFQQKLIQEISALEGSVKKRLQESTTVSLKEDPGASIRRINRLAEQLGDIDKKRAELLARREFVDQLVLQVDGKWNGQNLQSFLEHTALDMAATDLTNPQGSGDLWKFSTFLSITMREVPSGRDDVIGILEDYVRFASVLSPKTPTEFLAGRDYTNITASAPAHSVPQAEAGDSAESKSKGAPKPSHAANPTSDIELRMKIPPPSDNGSK